MTASSLFFFAKCLDHLPQQEQLILFIITQSDMQINLPFRPAAQNTGRAPVSMSRRAALAGQRPSTAKTPVSVPTQEFWAAHRIPCCRYLKLRPSESGTGEFQSTRTNPTAPPGGAGGAEPPVLSAGSIGERRKHCCTLDKPFYSLYYNTADKNFHTDLTKIICLSANM